MSFKTPGVYIKEVSLFPPSVAEVETAIPAFIGYTEKAERNGQNLINKPTKISSLLEYNALFGGAHQIDDVDVQVDENNNYAVTSVSIPLRFHLYDSLQLFFDNGGGDLYIVSVGLYSGVTTNVSFNDFKTGLSALEQYDEPTIILFPDAVELVNESEFFSLQQLALAQCNKLQDRVAVLDLKENISGGWKDSVANFRDGIGINNLKYGAAYTPFLQVAYPKTVPFSIFRNNVEDSTNAAVNLATLSTDSSLNTLVKNVNDAYADQIIYLGSVDTLDGTVDQKNTIAEVYKARRDALTGGTIANADTNLASLLDLLSDMILAAVGWQTTFTGTNLKTDLQAYASNSLAGAAVQLIGIEKNTEISTLTTRVANTIYASLDTTTWLDSLGGNPVSGIAGVTAGTYTGGDDLVTATNTLGELDAIFQELMGFYDSISASVQTHIGLTQNSLYQNYTIIGNIVKAIQRTMATLPPSGAMAGLYAFVDDSRGVWKAPANVSVGSVVGPSVVIDDNIQEGLNVDTTAGKSINAIRSFTGKGTLVWGARTLAGNDNEWRYVSVRRFFNVVEESVKKATAFAVFEPNDARTWSKVRALISNYLVLKWKDGALQGATPEEAFYVKVGLGLTMTADDILNGFMRVEIGMAVVRPAEFIILSFSHKLVGTP